MANPDVRQQSGVPVLRPLPGWLTAGILALVVLVGAALRFAHPDWDAGMHLHPDEREITMVAMSLHLPDAAQQGGLDPKFFAYGSLPLYLLAAVGSVLHAVAQGINGTSTAIPDTGPLSFLWNADDYGGMNVLGRLLSAAFDTGSILVCFWLGALLYGRSAGLLAAAMYAVAVLAVQQAHFYVVDPVVTFFVLLTLVFCVRRMQSRRVVFSVLAGVLFGCALATKVSAAPLGLALVLAHLDLTFAPAPTDGTPRGHPRVTFALGGALMALVAALATFVATEPYAVLDFTQFRHDVLEQSAVASGAADYPYTRQYAHTLPYLYWLWGLVTWQLGPLLGLSLLVGGAWQVVRQVRTPSRGELLLVAWWLPYFLITGAFYAKFPRYMLPVVPLWCVGAAGMAVLGWRAAPVAWLRNVIAAVAAVVVACSALYALAYVHIYAATNTRVAASAWMYQHIPPDTAGHPTTLTHEVWDDSLPLGIDTGNPALTPSTYAYVDLPIYDADDTTKQTAMVNDVLSADYIIESSEIVRGSIQRNPDRYPMTNAYYRALASGQLGFVEVASFRSGPTLGPITLDDRGADLNWLYYDHPPVTIYKKVTQLSAAQLTALMPLTTESPGELGVGQYPSLNLTPAQLAADAQSPALGAMFPTNGVGARFPLPVWLLTVELLGLVGLPWSIRLLRALPDSGFSGAKALAWLLGGWLTWLLASTGIAWNDRSTILAVLAALAVLAIAGYVTLKDLRQLIRQHWKLWLLSEGVFLAAFGVFVLIRAFNPDLWNLYRGGEKPMELSYMHAILRSQVLPPLDPWLSGTSINYYYFGLYLVTWLFRLTTIPVETGFNLAVPLVYALAMQLAAANGYAVTHAVVTWARRSAAPATLSADPERTPTQTSNGLNEHALVGGGLAALLFGVLGNLDSGPYLLGLLQTSAQRVIGGSIPVVDGVIQTVVGIVLAVATGGATLPDFNYFDRTRVIPNTINEFPSFSFLYADLHPHVIDMPFSLLAMAIVIGIVVGSGRLANRRITISAVLLAGLVLGALWPTNVWDYPVYLLLALGALWLRLWDGASWLRPTIGAVVGLALLVLIGRVAFWPFYQHFFALDTGIGITQLHSPLVPFLLVYGLFGFIAATFLVRTQVLGFEAVVLGAVPILAVALFTQAWGIGLLIGLLALAARLLWQRRHDTALVLPVLLLTMALCIILGTELVFVKDPLQGGDYQRMNTVFKFGIQAWLLLSVACGPLLVLIVNRWFVPVRPLASEEPKEQVRAPVLATLAPAASGISALMASAGGEAAVATTANFALAPAHDLGRLSADQPPGVVGRAASTNTGVNRSRLLWRIVLGLLIASAAVFPILAPGAKIRDRFPQQPATPSLDGMAFMQVSYPQDYAAIRWMQQNVSGAPVLLEANNGLYSWFGRVSWFTGLPTVLGWDYHTSQFHGDAIVAVRKQAVTDMYSTPDPVDAMALLQEYHVSLIYVGPLEIQQYAGSGGLAKFPTMVGSQLTVVYDQDGVQIYHVDGQP